MVQVHSYHCKLVSKHNINLQKNNGMSDSLFIISALLLLVVMLSLPEWGMQKCCRALVLVSICFWLCHLDGFLLIGQASYLAVVVKVRGRPRTDYGGYQPMLKAGEGGPIQAPLWLDLVDTFAPLQQCQFCPCSLAFSGF
jgi:hypothetical protein